MDSVLHAGTGEGDYDRLIHSFARRLVSCDIDEHDIDYACRLNADLSGLEYRIEDVLDLSFVDHSFDLIIAIDVIEHVSDSGAMMREVGRVLKPGGIAIISFPSLDFPFTYDPINRLLSFFDLHLPLGAYAFGHFKLLNPAIFNDYLLGSSFSTLRKQGLTSYLAAATEMYWPGVLQRMLKANSTNQLSEDRKTFKLRPTSSPPPFLFVVDWFIRLDRYLFSRCKASVGLAYVIQKSAEFEP